MATKIDLSKYVLAGQTPATKDEGSSNPHRVTVGSVFIQPTGGKGTKPYNFSYGYFGMLDSTGKFIAGFSMSNVKMLEAVAAGGLSEAFKIAFDEYAKVHMNQGHIVIKTA